MKNKLKKGKGIIDSIKEDGLCVNYKDLPSDEELKKIMEECWEDTVKNQKRRIVIYPYRGY